MSLHGIREVLGSKSFIGNLPRLDIYSLFLHKLTSKKASSYSQIALFRSDYS